MSTLISKIPIPYEPKRKNRFVLRFPSSMGIAEWYVSTAARPHATINPVEIPYLNTSTWVAGRFKWDAMNITFRDPIGPSGGQALMEWFRQHAESATGRMGYAVSYKKDIELDMLDPLAVPVEKWIIQGAMLTDINFQELNYSEDALSEIQVTIQPDRCFQVY